MSHLSDLPNQSLREIAVGQGQRRSLLHGSLNAGEFIEWDSRAVCTGAPPPHDSSNHVGHVVITNQRVIYFPEGEEPAAILYSEMDAPSMTKSGHKTSAITIPTKSGGVWIFDTDRSATKRILRHYRDLR
jgi:hypothetical protein